MRPGQQNKRGRGRGNNNGGGNNNNNNFNRKGGNPLTRSYDSSGPDVKIRGTAQHIAEKYTQLGRDAQSSGDRVMAENYLQHAEHYNRIIAAAQAQLQERYQREDRQDYYNGDGLDREGGDMDDMESDDVAVVQPPRQQHEGQSRRYDDQQRRHEDHQPRRFNGEQQRQQEQPHHREQPRQRPEQRLRDDHRLASSEEQPRLDEQPGIEDQPQANEAVPERTEGSDRRGRSGRPRRENRDTLPKSAAPLSADVEASDPQPEIPGIPAEVSMEEEASVQKPRRRVAAGSRSRRPRRVEGEGEAPSDQAELAEAASE